MINHVSEKALVTKPTKKYTHTLGNFHQSSTAFMQASVLCKRVIKEDTQNEINFDSYIRLEALPQPTMGLANAKYKWFYVPYRQVFPNWGEFITQSLVHGESTPSFCNWVPTFDTYEVTKGFYHNNNLTTVKGRIDQDAPNPYTGTDYDLVYTNGLGESYALKLTYRGFCEWNLLHQLGYVLPSYYNSKYPTIYKSALPLLAFAKIMLDYYIPKDWANFEYNYNTVYKYFKSQTTDLRVATSDVFLILELMFYISYENDINTMGWNNPTGPNNTSQMPIMSITDVVTDTAQNQIENTGSEAQLVIKGNVSQLALNRLAAMDKMMKKNAIVGTKYWDRLLARFGVKTDKALINVPYNLFNKTTPIILNEVISTAETATQSEGANLGALAGKGESYIDGESNFTFYAEEQGLLFCILTIIPEVGYRNFEDEDCRAIEPLDYYNEEYDGTGTQPMYRFNVCGQELGASYLDEDKYWSFLPMYYWYKASRSRISGKYALPSTTNENIGWTFSRVFDKPGATVESLPNNINMQFGIGTIFISGINLYHTRYDDIFYTNEDHNFNVFYTMAHKMKNTMKPLFDYCLIDEMEEGEKPYHVNINEHE